jgi:hypothetical protein
MNLRLRCLLGWATLLTALTACSEQKLDPSQIRQMREQVEALREAQSQQNRALSALKTTLSTRDDSWYKEQERTTSLRTELKSIEQQMAALHQEFAEYKDSYREFIRKVAPGLTLGDIVMNGQVYRSLKIKTLDDAEICFSHAGGFGKADSMALPIAFREKFVIDSSKAESAKLAQLETRKEPSIIDAALEPQTEVASSSASSASNQPRSVTPAVLYSSQLMNQPPVSTGYTKSNFTQSVMDQKYRRRGVTRSRVNGGARFTGGGGSSGGC